MPKVKDFQTPEGRTCQKCDEFKPPEAFNKNGKLADGTVRLRAICRACGSRRKTENHEPKRCASCGEMKPASEFRMRGTYSDCKPCQNAKVAAYHKTEKGRKVKNDSQARYQKERYANDPEHRERFRAWHAVHKAIAVGVLVKPTECPICGRETKIEAHHHMGYEPEHWLDVVWRCRRCHYREHNPR